MSGERLVRESPSIEAKSEPKPQTEEVKTPVQAEDEKPEEAAASAQTTSGDESAVEGQEPKPKKADGGFQRKINKLTARVKESEAAIAERERVIQELQAKVTGTSTGDPEPTRPDASKFSDWDALDKAKEQYTADLAAWRVRQEIKKEQTTREAKQLQDLEAEDNRTARQTFEKRAMDIADKYEGLDEAIDAAFSGEIPTSKAMADFIMKVSDRGPELVFALYSNPEEAERISKLSPLAAAREMTKLEASLPKEEKKASGAPKPPNVPKGTAESPTKKLEDASFAEYRAIRMEQEKKAGTLRRMINNG